MRSTAAAWLQILRSLRLSSGEELSQLRSRIGIRRRPLCTVWKWGDRVTPAAATNNCVTCGEPLLPDSRFCTHCGAAAPEPDQPASDGVAPAITAYRDKVTVALRQLMQGDQPARLMSAATGLTQDLASRLRATLVNAATPAPPPEPVSPEPPAIEPAAALLPEPYDLPPPKPSRPEPKRSMSVGVRLIREPAPRRGIRTLTGLVLGRGASYIAYGRAEASRLLSPPDFIRLDARTAIPTAVRLAGQRTSELCGNRALLSWVRSPADVRLGFTEALAAAGATEQTAVEQTNDAIPAIRAFLKFLNYRLVEVLGPDASDAREGASTLLAVSVGRGEPSARLLAELVEQAGFPVVQLVPEPLAAVAPYLARNSSAGLTEAQHFLVIDWGSQGLDLAVVEDAPDAGGPVVIDHVENPLGGTWFDVILEGWLAERLPGELSEEDRRALTLFARQFKEKASISFVEGRNEHVQYCVLPVGLPPTRISMTRAEFDDLCHESRDHFEEIVAEAPARVGFQAEHFDQVVMVGGSARCCFARDAVRKALGRDPMIAPNPEESIAKGLIFSGIHVVRGANR